MKGYSIEYKLVTSNYGIEYKVVTSFILHLEYKWSIVLQSRHTRGGGINIIYSLESIMVYHHPKLKTATHCLSRTQTTLGQELKRCNCCHSFSTV